MNTNIKEILKPALILTAICIVVTGLLAVTFDMTDEVITLSEQTAAEQSRREVLKGAESFELIKTDVAGIKDAYKGSDKDGNVSGYVFTSVKKGYGGDIAVMTGINADGTISRVKILSASETPGLGEKAKNEDFLSLYSGNKGPLTVVKRQAGENEITAITGATITSKAVTEAVNAAIEAYNRLTKG